LAKKQEKEAKTTTSSRPPFTRDSVPHSAERDRERRKSLSRPLKRSANPNSIRFRRKRGGASRSSDWDSVRSTTKDDRPPSRPINNHIIPDFMPPSDVTHFSSPPLLPGLVESVTDVLGSNARPTPIQALSLKHLFNEDQAEWRQYLLASETGSGKSIAYLLPMLQALKKSELVRSPMQGHPQPRRSLNPRGLILAPTHELARQLSGFAKALLHNIKLRVQCVSRANVENVGRNLRSSKMAERFDLGGGAGAEFAVTGPMTGKRVDVDVLVGTPNRVLEMVRGYRWADSEGEGSVRSKRMPEMGLQGVEWVVVDEADVLFGE
jgi:ATP-dependent RNA helicase MRH4, mitochondrial